MASVQELILAAQAQQKRSPVASSLESFLGAVNNNIVRRPDALLKAAKLRALQEDEARRIRAEKDARETMKRIRKSGNFVEDVNIGPSGATLSIEETTAAPVALPKSFEERWVKNLQTGNQTLNDVLAEKHRLEGLASKDPKTEAEKQKIAVDLRKEAIDRGEVKDAISVNTQVNAMDGLLRSALEGNQKNRIALEQALVTMFNKITDPGSVVRESEFARTPENAPIVNRIQGSIRKVKEGGVGLTDEDRIALVLGAKIIANHRTKAAQTTLGGYDQLFNKLGLDQTILTDTIPSFQQFNTDPAQYINTSQPTIKINSVRPK